MKAEDTVMSREELEQVYRDGLIGWWLRIAQAQAGISFKAGTREVVEWLRQYAIRGGKVPLSEVISDLETHSPFG